MEAINPILTCPTCGNRSKDYGHIDHTHGELTRVYLIRDRTITVCPRCGTITLINVVDAETVECTHASAENMFELLLTNPVSYMLVKRLSAIVAAKVKLN